MRHKKRTGKAGRRWLAMALLLAGILLIFIFLSLDNNVSSLRSPVYLPHGDVIFLPRG